MSRCDKKKWLHVFLLKFSRLRITFSIKIFVRNFIYVYSFEYFNSNARNYRYYLAEEDNFKRSHFWSHFLFQCILLLLSGSVVISKFFLCYEVSELNISTSQILESMQINILMHIKRDLYFISIKPFHELYYAKYARKVVSV